MYPEAPTHTEELIALIKSNSQKVTDIIKEYIEKHDTSKMDEGVRYYFNESDINKRQIYMYENDTKVVDEDATNNKLPTSWHKRIVDQKVGYLAGKPITIESNQYEDPALKRIIELLGDEFEDIIPELIKNASNKGKEWLHPYIDENGDFDYMIVPAQELIPIYDNTKRKNIIGGIRFYNLDDGTRKIELWDDQQVTFYEESEDGIVLDVSYNVNPQSHFYYGSGETIQGYGWGKVVGQALDFVPVNSKGETLWNGYEAADVKKAIKEAKRLGFEWGGDWKGFVDKPHLQYNYKGYATDTYNGSKADTPSKEKGAKPSNIGTSIVDYLKSKGIDSSFANREKLAKQHGINDYEGSEEQNTLLLEKLQSGAKPVKEINQKKPSLKAI